MQLVKAWTFLKLNMMKKQDSCPQIEALRGQEMRIESANINIIGIDDKYMNDPRMLETMRSKFSSSVHIREIDSNATPSDAVGITPRDRNDLLFNEISGIGKQLGIERGTLNDSQIMSDINNQTTNDFQELVQGLQSRRSKLTSSPEEMKEGYRGSGMQIRPEVNHFRLTANQPDISDL